MLKNYSKRSVKPYSLHATPTVTESSPTSSILDSAHYADNRRWLIEHLGIDVELVRHDPAFWLGVSVGANMGKLRADNGTAV